MLPSFGKVCLLPASAFLPLQRFANAVCLPARRVPALPEHARYAAIVPNEAGQNGKRTKRAANGDKDLQHV